MDKTAQKRRLSKLYEWANVPARSAEEFFKPELKRVMKTLGDADDVVRSTLAGDKVGNALPEDKVSAKNLLKEAKSFINRREYMSAIASLGRFHKKMSDVADVLKKLDLNISSLHHKFLFEKLPLEHRKHLQGLRERLGAETHDLTKEAGIMDFFHNIGTQRGRALAAWEKKYPKEVGPIRDGALSQLDSAQAALNQVLALLKEMAYHRGGRRIDHYLDTAKEVISAVNRYDAGKNGFRTFYNEVVKPRLERLEAEEKQATLAIPTPDATQMGKQEVNAPPATSTQPVAPVPEAFTSPSSSTTSTVLPPPPATPTGLASTPVIVQDTDPSPPPEFKSEEEAQKLEQMVGKKSANEFLQYLDKLSSQDPIIVAAYIRKYAQCIQQQNPEAAIQLFNIAKSLRG